MKNEPALTVGAITALVTAAIGALVAFGVDVTPDQRDAILGLVVAIAGVAPFVSALITRHFVSPADKVNTHRAT